MMPAQPARAPTWFFGDGPTLPSASASSPPPASAENGDGERPALKRSESRVAWQSASGRTSAALALSRMAHTVRGATLAKRLCRIPMDTVCAGSGKRPCPKAAERKVSPGADAGRTDIWAAWARLDSGFMMIWAAKSVVARPRLSGMHGTKRWTARGSRSSKPWRGGVPP